MYVVKPQSSRASSAEAFVIGLGFIENSKLEVISESISSLKTIKATEKSDDSETNETEQEEEDKLTF